MRNKLIITTRRGLSTMLKGPDRILPASDCRAWEPDSPVKIRLKETGFQSKAPQSIPTLFKETVEKLPNHPALGVKGKDGRRLTWTYTNYMEDVLNASKGFIALGLEPFHSVCILGGNSPEWVISHVAAVHARGFATGIYQTNSVEACHYVSEHSRANIIVVDNDVQLHKILAIKDKLPHLKKIVQFKGSSSPTEGVVSWDQLLELGKSESDETLNTRLGEMAANQCALLVYTSGTTGNPKGAMLSHDSVVLNSTVAPLQVYQWRFGQERICSYLPLSHIAGSMMDIYWSIGTGSTTYFADENALKGSLVDNLKEFKPTRFLGVPRVWEKIEESIKLAGKNNTGIKKKIGDWAKTQALQHHLARNGGSTATTLQYKLAKKLVLSNVHKALGLDEVVNMEMATGGAATPGETHKFFYSLDMRLFDIYGSTESCGSPQASGKPGPGMCKIGTIGKNPEGYVESKLFNLDNEGAGEIYSRGRGMFMGYLADKEKTLQTIDEEGWVHSGDVAKQDSDGFFQMVGRTKEIIITSGGENIAPVNIEDEIKRNLPNLVSNLMLVGEGRKFLTCLITLKVEVDPETMQPTNKLTEQVLEVLEGLSIPLVETVTELINSEAIVELDKYIREGVEKANSKAVSNAAKVQKWQILPQEFSVQGGELSPSLKLKRFHVIEKYSQVIDSMYDK